MFYHPSVWTVISLSVHRDLQTHFRPTGEQAPQYLLIPKIHTPWNWGRTLSRELVFRKLGFILHLQIDIHLCVDLTPYVRPVVAYFSIGVLYIPYVFYIYSLTFSVITRGTSVKTTDYIKICVTQRYLRSNLIFISSGKSIHRFAKHCG